MRVVVDTNVFISASLKENSPPETAVHLAAASHLLIKSSITEQELFVTLARPRLTPLIDPHFRDWLHELMAAAELVEIAERITACRDPKDDKFLGASGQRSRRSNRHRRPRSARAQSVPGNSDHHARRLRAGRCAKKAQSASGIPHRRG
jgi:putative PIN family toxin of toxin-antitoxin system